MKVLFINSVVDFGSTGRIVRDLSEIEGIYPKICYGRNKATENENTNKITGILGNCCAMINTLLFNKNGLSNKNETIKLIKIIDYFCPDIIHIHNLHGYYINFSILFKYLNSKNISVIWTFHDCWPITGYCVYFDYIGCSRYKNKCDDRCPAKFSYPFSIFKQNISEAFELKKELFSNCNLTIVTPSEWLANVVKKSFLKDKEVVVINNGIDLNFFKPISRKNEKFTIIMVANVWTIQKGLNELKRLIDLVNEEIEILVVGSIEYNEKIAKRCRIIKRTNSKEELASLYSCSHLFVNLTLEDNFPTVNIESLACGTPVLTYNTGGSPEIIDKKTGIIVEKYNVIEMANEINKQYMNYTFNPIDCVKRSQRFSKEIMLKKYYDIYNRVVKQKSIKNNAI